MATGQHKMEEFLSTIVQGKTSVWAVEFLDSRVVLKNEVNVQAIVDLEEYPWDVRKDFIHKLRLANISSLAIKHITVVDKAYHNFMGGLAKLPDGHATLTEDIAEIIKTLQWTPTTEESNVVGEGGSQNGQAECNLMVATVSSAHQIEQTNRTLTGISIMGELPPQKLKAVCGLTAAPGSTVKSVTLDPSPMDYNRQDGRFQCRVLEEMLSAAQKKGGSCLALKSFTFHAGLVWSGTAIEHLGEFLQRTPSIKELVFYGLNSCVDAEQLAEAVCLSNQVHALQLKASVSLADNGLDLDEAVMRLLMRDSQGQHPLTALNCLHLEYVCGSHVSLLCEFIKTTKCLTDLRITAVGKASNLEVIEALKFNHGLEHFALGGDHVPHRGEDVLFSTVMDTLRVNYQLKDFVYPWRNNYYAEALTMLFEERATNKPWEVMKDMVLVPSTSARLFFCGYPHAGDFLWLVYVSYCMHAICEIVTK